MSKLWSLFVLCFSGLSVVMGVLVVSMMLALNSAIPEMLATGGLLLCGVVAAYMLGDIVTCVYDVLRD